MLLFLFSFSLDFSGKVRAVLLFYFIFGKERKFGKVYIVIQKCGRVDEY